MKKYKQYMDGIKVSNALHERLINLHVPSRQTVWRRYGTAAAMLLLIAGLGLWGVGRLSDGQVEKHWRTSNGEVETAQTDIALEQPGDMVEQGKQALGGYEVTVGSVTAYYMLPYIDYGQVDTRVDVFRYDWDIPQGTVKRDLTGQEITALLGGKEALFTHLNWDSYELSGWAAWYEDGSLWGTVICGSAGPLDHFEFAMTVGDLPPTCVAYSESVKQDIGGVTVTASGHDSAAGEQGGMDAVSRQVSFMKDGDGYRFDLTGTSRALTEERVSRFVRRTVMDGLFDPSALTPVRREGVSEGNLLDGGSYSVGEPNWED